MSFSTLKFLVLSGLGLSLFLGNTIAFAQTSSGDIVVPTEPANGTSTTTTTSTTGNSTSTSTVINNSSTTISSNRRFACLDDNGQYTVMYQPESQPGRYFAWATPRSLGGGWDAYKRCAAIADRLESYRPDGLTELRVSTLNGYNVLCVTTEVNPSCRLVLTVPPGYDAYNVRNSVFQNLITADSGQSTIGVNTYTNRNNNSGVEQIYNLGREILGGSNNSTSNNNNRPRSSRDPINLKPYLDAKDGGNGRLLKNGVAIRSQPQNPGSAIRLSPGKFR